MAVTAIEVVQARAAACAACGKLRGRQTFSALTSGRVSAESARGRGAGARFETGASRQFAVTRCRQRSSRWRAAGRTRPTG